jgi:hypothetical protein
MQIRKKWLYQFINFLRILFCFFYLYHALIFFIFSQFGPGGIKENREEGEFCATYDGDGLTDINQFFFLQANT